MAVIELLYPLIRPPNTMNHKEVLVCARESSKYANFSIHPYIRSYS